jgi:hypothetical protein
MLVSAVIAILGQIQPGLNWNGPKTLTLRGRQPWHSYVVRFVQRNFEANGRKLAPYRFVYGQALPGFWD